jgi:hypothetical protein
MSRESRRIAIVASGLTPLVFALGASALWYANATERAARPPFVLSRVLLALCAAYPIWSIFRGSGSLTRGPVND